MGFGSYLKCWMKRNKLADNDQRRIYVGDVPVITDSGTDLNEQLLHAQSLENVPSVIGESTSGIGENMFSAQEPLDRQPVHPVPVRRASDPAPKFRPRNQHFRNNQITSSRYTVWNFFFKNIYQQFRRVTNFFFLTVAIIQTIIDSPVSPVTALAPLIFVVSVTMIKQGYEDYLRHKADASVNQRKVQIVKDEELVKIMSKDIKVGDIVKLELDEQVPTDLIVIASSDDYHRCQINTANLDGETNLKVRYCPSGLYHFKTEADFHRLHVVVECEQPNADLYTFNGNLLIPSSKIGGTIEGSGTMNPEDDNSRISSGRRSSTRKIDKSFSVTGDQSPVSDFLQIPLSMDNIVLRGTRVKNTDYIFGLVVYTGEDTRLAQNSKNSSPKLSSVEKAVTSHLLVFMLVLATLIAIASTIHYTVKWYPDDTWYIPPGKPNESAFATVFNVCASFLILFNYIIPISLCVTLELQKFIGSKFFVWDAEMATDNGSPPLCNTSDLNEELGQIEYLFSDKTGTLTENIMKFRYCSIQDKTYIFDDEKLYLRNYEDNTNIQVDISKNEAVRKFLIVLALCHTVQLMPVRRPSIDSAAGSFGLVDNLKKKRKKISSKLKNASSLFSVEAPKPQRRCTLEIGGKWEYQASSPDEKALLEACFQLEVIYYGEKENILSVEVFGKREVFKRHYILEFDADRKCMSVILENDQGEIFLLTKGAETAIIPNCNDGSAENIGKHVLDFAKMGLRTLVVAERKLTRDELHDFSTNLKHARRLLKNRETKMREVYRFAENNLTILGATGVEDQLQAGVPETLQALGAAGIRVWMLTGDKVETGVNVAVACGLITASSKQIFLTNLLDGDEIKRRLTETKAEMEEGDNTTFVVDGISLATAFSCCPDLLCDVTMKAFRVVCCRMAPLQKAKVVHMVKNTPKSPICAAVGDGANDVAMIQEAHLGIGILGKEGRQAARCSDFALGKFCFLKKAILVHGHWYYVRLSVLANYFFYKNFLFVLPQVFFCFHSAFSTQALFEGLFLMLYNIFFSACPIFWFGLLDQNYSAQILLTKPHLYKKIRRNVIMSWTQFMHWLFAALWHAGVSYFIPYLAWSFFEPISDLKSFGTVVFCCLVAVGNMKMAIETKFITWFYVGAQCYSYLTMFLFTSIYSELDAGPLSDFINPGMFRHVYFTVLSSVPFYIVLACVIITANLPDVLFRGLKGSWSKVSKFWKNIPKKLKLGHMKRKSILRLPQFSLLFNKRTGKLTVSNTTLTSYQPKQDLHVNYVQEPTYM